MIVFKFVVAALVIFFWIGFGSISDFINRYFDK